MRRLLLVLLGLLVAIAGTALCQGDLFHDPPPLIIMQERVAYSVAPPRKITVEISNAYLLVHLMSGWIVMCADLPAPPPHVISAILFDSYAEDLKDYHKVIYGMWPGATYYQVRPSTKGWMVWEDFALQIDVPKLELGTPPGLGVNIIPAARFGSLPMASEKFAITPAPTVELEPVLSGELLDTRITFPTVSLEWIEWSHTARYRVGNVVLYSDLYWWWDVTNPNAIYIDNFHIDLVSGIVSYYDIPTLLPVIIDDGDPNAIYLEPDLWR